MKIYFRKPQIEDALLYFEWLNDEAVRRYSFTQEEVSLNNHLKWFDRALKCSSTFLYLFLTTDEIPVGQVRIDEKDMEVIIGISVATSFRGCGLSKTMLDQAVNAYLSEFPGTTISAYIKAENLKSIQTFKNAGFMIEEEITIKGARSYKLRKKP